jgi:prepilin-type N-terminal cleavage/methylation domain-containing protein
MKNIKNFFSFLSSLHSSLPSLRANAKQSRTSVIPAQRVSIAKQYPKIKLSFTNSGQPACGLDSQLSAENDDFKKSRNYSKGRFPPNYSEGMTVGYSEEKTVGCFEGMTNRAFTLIELLVVVLIIGILAAIALPQYKKSVEKTRATEALIILKAISKANDMHFLATGSYTKDMDDLDVEIPGAKGEVSGLLNRSTTQFFNCGVDNNNSTKRKALCTRLPLGGETYVIVTSQDNKMYCLSQTDKKYDYVCEALGGKETGNLSPCVTLGGIAVSCYLLN